MYTQGTILDFLIGEHTGLQLKDACTELFFTAVFLVIKFNQLALK